MVFHGFSMVFHWFSTVFHGFSIEFGQDQDRSRIQLASCPAPGGAAFIPALFEGGSSTIVQCSQEHTVGSEAMKRRFRKNNAMVFQSENPWDFPILGIRWFDTFIPFLEAYLGSLGSHRSAEPAGRKHQNQLTTGQHQRKKFFFQKCVFFVSGMSHMDH